MHGRYAIELELTTIDQSRWLGPQIQLMSTLFLYSLSNIHTHKHTHVVSSYRFCPGRGPTSKPNEIRAVHP